MSIIMVYLDFNDYIENAISFYTKCRSFELKNNYANVII